MSGVFGAVAFVENIENLIMQMGQEMSHCDWHEVESYIDPTIGLGLGRIGIGIFNPNPQPVWNTTHTIALVMAGELYHTGPLKVQFQVETDEQLALALYERQGSDFVKQLNGAFIITIWDGNLGQLVIANDRFGLYPLFYAHYHGKFLFAPEMKGILCAFDLPKKLDLVALAEYMRFQHLLGDKTFFENIKLMPGASILVCEISSASILLKPYWTYNDIPYRPKVTIDEAIEETGKLLRQAVQCLSGDAYRPGVYLSGGLDSRTILGLVEHDPVASLSYGAANCRDVYYATKIAKAVGSQHHWVDFPNGQWVQEWVNFHLELTEGFHSWIHAHGISTLPLARQVMDVNLTGWDGGTIMGHPDSVEPLQTQAVDDQALLTRLFYLFCQQWTWPSVTEAESNLLFSEPISKQLAGLAFESFCAELSPFLNYRSDVRADYFYLRNHCGRLTHNLVTFTRSHIEVRFPFFDYDLFDFLYSLPAGLRSHRILYQAVLQQETPRLALIPYDHDEFLPTSRSLLRNGHALVTKLKYRFNRHLYPIFSDHQTLYADYENYLRGELRSWAEAILFDSRTLERGIFNPDFIKSIWARHQSRLELHTIGKIAPIMTYEMMLRRFVD